MNVNETGSSKLGAEPMDVFGTIDDLDCRGRRVFLRADAFLVDSLDVPTPACAEPALGVEASAPRTPEAVSSLRRLIELEARVIVGAHASAETGNASVESLALRLSEKLGLEVLMPDECVGDAAVRAVQNLRQGQICVLPDLLSCGAGESRNDETFARALAAYVDAYVNDAFSASHLEYASLVRLPRLAPRRALGFRARRELQVLSQVFALSRGAVSMGLGGQHFSDKIDVLSAWLPRLSTLCVGGGVANTLLCATGQLATSASAEQSRLAQARSLLTRARDLGVVVLLPVDLRVQWAGEAQTRVVTPRGMPDGAQIVDVGPESLQRFSEALGKATNVLWWGPFGNVAHPDGAASSRELAELCARPSLMSVVIGGDTRRFVRQLPPEVGAQIDLVSTGSGAAKALLMGQRLPGIEALRARH
jgi:phosphoglycerate kinase